MREINLALIMWGQLMGELSIKVTPVQNKNYFVDGSVVKCTVYGKRQQFVFRIIGGIVTC